MKSRILGLVLLLASTISAFGQTTTVTGIVIDPNGIRYSLGTMSAVMQLPSPAPSPIPALTSVTNTLDSSGGEWVNTTAQITSVAMLTAGGSVTMGAGTSIAVFGKNF